MKPKVRLIVLTAVVLALLVAGIKLPVKQYLLSLLEWTQGLGFWGPLVLAVVYILATVLMAPGLILTIGAGLIFGVVKGTITVSIASTIGACAAFLIGNSLARKLVEAKIFGNATFARIDEAVGSQGFKIVLLTRLSPIFPFNLLNYAYGLTKVSFRNYALASWIGMFPGTLMYVYIGSVARSLTELATGAAQPAPGQQVLKWVGFAATIVVVIFVTRIARKSLKEATGEGEKE